jgi:uncharacterized protein (DUF427 family)
MTRRPRPEPAGTGQESVWDYPRPPAVVPSSEHVVVEVGGVVVADTRRAIRVLETSHPPTYYVPADDVRWDLLAPSDRRTVCEFKGVAAYADVVVGERRIRDACWWYAAPASGYEAIAGAVCFYPQRVDRCLVDGEEVRAVEGDFYGGWITARVAGPFKGGPGTYGW